MSGRVRVCEGEAAEQAGADAVVLPAEGEEGLEPGAAAGEPGEPGRPLRIRAAAEPGDEASLVSALRAALGLAAVQGARHVAVAPLGAGPGELPLRRRAELLLAEAREALEGGLEIDELRFAVPGEPSFRVFESVQDAARVEAQMRRLAERRGG